MPVGPPGPLQLIAAQAESRANAHVVSAGLFRFFMLASSISYTKDRSVC
jgi:hypothetical protein